MRSSCSTCCPFPDRLRQPLHSRRYLKDVRRPIGSAPQQKLIKNGLASFEVGCCTSLVEAKLRPHYDKARIRADSGLRDTKNRTASQPCARFTSLIFCDAIIGIGYRDPLLPACAAISSTSAATMLRLRRLPRQRWDRCGTVLRPISRFILRGHHGPQRSPFDVRLKENSCQAKVPVSGRRCVAFLRPHSGTRPKPELRRPRRAAATRRLSR
jgi:hypothetical protein